MRVKKEKVAKSDKTKELLPKVVTIDKFKIIQVGKNVVTTKLLRVLFGLIIPEGHHTQIYAMKGDKVKIECRKTFAWVSSLDVKVV